MPPGLLACVALSCLGTIVVGGGQITWAAENPGRRAGGEAAIIVLAGGERATAAAIKNALRASMRRVGVDATFTAAPRMNARHVAEASAAASPSTVRVWLDLTAARSVTLYVSQSDKVFVRRLNFDGAFDAVALDFVDVVVTSSIQAALAGKQDGITRDEFRRSLDAAPSPPGPGADRPSPSPSAPSPSLGAAPVAPSPPLPAPLPNSSPPPIVERPAAGEVAPPQPPPSAASPESSRDAAGVARTRWSLGTFYEGALVASSRATHGPGLSLDAERGAVRLGLSVHGRLPYEARGAGATVRLAPEGIRLSLAALAYVRPTLAVLASLAIGGDLTYVSTNAEQADLTARSARWAFDPMLRPSFGLESHHGRWRWGLIAGVDLDLMGGRYVIVDGESPAPANAQSVWVPWRWRPFAALSLAVTL